jgi:DNA-binding transcriptional LysR family regulator
MTIGLDFDYNLARDQTHEADIWLTYEQPAEPDLITSKLATIHFAVYASKSYIQRHGIPSTIDSLKAIGSFNMSVLACAPSSSIS